MTTTTASAPTARRPPADPRPAFFTAAQIACDARRPASPRPARPTPRRAPSSTSGRCSVISSRCSIGSPPSPPGAPAVGQVPLVTDVPDDGWGAAARGALADVRAGLVRSRGARPRAAPAVRHAAREPPRWPPTPASSARTRGTSRSPPASPPPGTRRCWPARWPPSARKLPTAERPPERPVRRRRPRARRRPAHRPAGRLAGPRPALAARPEPEPRRRRSPPQPSCGATSAATRSRWSRSDEVEHLQVDPLRAGLGVPAQDVDRLGRRAGDAVRAQLVHLAADRGGPAGDLGLVLAHAEHQRRAVDQGRRVAAGLLAGLADAGEQPRVVLGRGERHVELARRTGRPAAASASCPRRRR